MQKRESYPDSLLGEEVADYREYQLSQKSNVETYLESSLDADQVLEFGFENVCIATGSTWRADGVSRQHVVPIPNDHSINYIHPMIL